MPTTGVCDTGEPRNVHQQAPNLVWGAGTYARRYKWGGACTYLVAPAVPELLRGTDGNTTVPVMGQ
jgi:hypothetical protein